MAATITAPRTARELLRVSADKSGRMVSTDQQHKANAAMAAGLGITLGSPYIQTDDSGNAVAVSASRYGRKARADLASLISDLKCGTFGADAISLWDLNRGTRDWFDGGHLVKTMLAAQVPYLVVTTMAMTLDMRNGKHRKIARDAWSQAEAESDDKSETVGRAMAEEAASGQPHGRVVYGYRREYRISADLPAGWYRLASDESKIARQVEHPEQGPVVRDIFTSILAGESLASIGRRHSMEPTRVRDIALNVHYAGKRRHVPDYRGGHQPEITDADLSDGLWPPLVSYPDWRKVYAILRNPARRTSPPGRAPKHLVSLIASAPCGGLLTVRTQSDRPAYTCRNDGCCTIARDDLDAYVTAAVLALVTDPQAWAMVNAGDDGALDAAQAELDAAQAEQADLVRLVRQGKLSAVLAAAAEAPIRARLDAAGKRVQELSAPAGLADMDLGPGADFVARWDAAPMTARRQVIRTLFASIVVKPVGRGPAVPAEDRTEITRRS